jgi:hypothetical protein
MLIPFSMIALGTQLAMALLKKDSVTVTPTVVKYTDFSALMTWESSVDSRPYWRGSAPVRRTCKAA